MFSVYYDECRLVGVYGSYEAACAAADALMAETGVECVVCLREHA